MKVLIVTDSVEETGGAETYCINLAKSLSEAGHQVRVACCKGNIEGIETIRLPDAQSSHIPAVRMIWNGPAITALSREIARFAPDAVHFNNSLLHIGPAIMYSKVKTRKVLSIHSYGVIRPRIVKWGFATITLNHPDWESEKVFSTPHAAYTLLRSIWVRRCALHADALLANSKYMKSVLIKEGFKHVDYIHPVVRDLHETRQRSPRDILIVGRINAQKGVKQAIEAFAQIEKKHKKSHLLIAGDGEQRAQLEQLVSELSLQKRIKFLGKVPNKKIQSIYRKAAVLVFPSIWQEPFGLTGIEAMQTGVPVIGHPVGGVPEWLENNKNGLLTPPGDSFRLARAMDKILSNQQLQKRLSRGALDTAERFSKREHIKKICSVYAGQKPSLARRTASATKRKQSDP